MNSLSSNLSQKLTEIGLIGVVALIMTATFAQQSQAQTRAETSIPARVVVEKTCSGSDAAAANPGGKGESGLGVVAALVAGDLVKAGVSALGAALEEAAREHAVSFHNTTTFDYYALESKPPDGPFIKKMNLGAWCLVLWAQPSDVQKSILTAAEAKNSAPLYFEAYLDAKFDGFVVRPVVLNYRERLSEVPRHPQGLEVHLSFSTPGVPNSESGRDSTFAVGIIALPLIKPGTILNREDLIGYQSSLLPHRPSESVDRRLSEVNAVLSAVDQARSAQQNAERQFQRAKHRLAIAPRDVPQVLAALEADVLLKQEALEDRNRELEQASDRRDRLLDDLPKPLLGGTVAAEVRVSFIRSASRFKAAFGEALKGRAPTFGDSVAAALNPPATPAWTAADSAFVSAMGEVDKAASALSLAETSGDAVAIVNAQVALRTAQASANEKAALAGRAIPFPGLRG